MENLKATPRHKDYLEKTFLEELNHKLWSTKGARFIANKRLLEVSDLSNNALSYLSAYLIIFGLITVYQITNAPIIGEKAVAFFSTALSILLLVLSQSEAAKDYKLKAHQFHECALKIGVLYNELKIFKTLGAPPTPEETKAFCADLILRYQAVLEQYPNHESLDFQVFKAENREYYQVSIVDVFLIKMQAYFSTKLKYHFFMYAPPVIFVLLTFIKG